MTQKKPKRSGRITLRVPPTLHDELAHVADRLGLDINGLINLMIRRSFDGYRLEAAMLNAQRRECVELITAWREEEGNRDRPVREFWEDYLRYAEAKRRASEDAVDKLRERRSGIFDFDTQAAMIREVARQELLHKREDQDEQSKTTGQG